LCHLPTPKNGVSVFRRGPLYDHQDRDKISQLIPA
jgi:hypothetical protein